MKDDRGLVYVVMDEGKDPQVPVAVFGDWTKANEWAEQALRFFTVVPVATYS